MGTAFRRIDIVYERKYALVVGIVMLQGYFHINVIFRSLEIHHFIVKGNFAGI